jgi:hypothetical protein
MKSDYTTEPKQYKPRKPIETPGYADIFYEKHNAKDGKSVEFIKAQGRLWKYNGYDFYIARTKKGAAALYKITEGKTGILIASKNTLKEVQDAARDITKNIRGGQPMNTPFAIIVEQNIKNHGISPLYQEEEQKHG